MDLISVAEKSRLSVWRYASQAILANIPADDYRVIVPRRELSLFRAKTPSEITVEWEEDYIQDFSRYLWESIRDMNPRRYGWYLQQLIKLEALRRCGVSSRRGLVWDADTMPLQPIGFFGQGSTEIFGSDEHHPPYFTAIEGLLGLGKIVDRSFVSQSFPSEPRWIVEFCDFIEARHGVPWWRAVIESIDFRNQSGFSEYETLGTFVSHMFPEDWSWKKGTWYRDGYAQFGGPRKALNASRKISAGAYFPAFEPWEPTRKSSIVAVLGRYTETARQVSNFRAL